MSGGSDDTSSSSFDRLVEGDMAPWKYVKSWNF